MRIFIEGVVAWAIIVALFYLAFAFVSLDWLWITSETREAYACAAIVIAMKGTG